MHLCAEAVERLALALKSVDHVECGHGLSAGMLSVANGVADNVSKERLQDTAGLFVHHSGDALDSTTTGKTTDGRLGDSLDVVTHDLAMTLGTFSRFSFGGHCGFSIQRTIELQNPVWHACRRAELVGRTFAL